MHPAERTAHLSPSELTALRRKKNADAQAAFRKRRANYISTLEETVNNLEQVVRSLQETIQDANMTQHNLKSENSRLKFELESMRKSQPPTPQPHRLEQAPWSASGVGFRPPSQPSSLHHYPATGSATPPLSATNSTPSPATGSSSSSSLSTSVSTPYQTTLMQPPASYAPDDAPMNLLSRPVFRSGPDVKPQFPAGGENMYAFQPRPQDAGGWVDSPVESPTAVTHGGPYVVADPHSQLRPLYTGGPVSRYTTEPMTPVAGPHSLSLSIDDQHRRNSVHNSASTSPTSTDPDSPLAFSPRGPAAMYVAAQQQHQGMDTGAAFRQYFNHATGAAVTGAVQQQPGPASAYQSQADDQDDMDDDEYERGGDGQQALSDTLAVLKAHAFGGVRKPRARGARGGRDDAGRGSMASRGLD